jgi:hypothetical protein
LAFHSYMQVTLLNEIIIRTLGVAAACINSKMASRCRQSTHGKQLLADHHSHLYSLPLIFTPIYLHSRLSSLPLIFTPAYIHSRLYSPPLIFTPTYIHPHLSSLPLIFTPTYIQKVQYFVHRPVILSSATHRRQNPLELRRYRVKI